MTTAYTSLLGLALPVTGELSGTWGDTVNNSITSLLDSAIAGTTTLSSDADVTLTTTTGASNTSRQAIILWTAGGTVTRNITAPAQSKIYTVINKSSSTQSIVLRGVGPTTGVTIVQGESAVCAWNGSDFIKISNTSGAGVFTTLSVTGVATFSAGSAAAPAITTSGDTNTGIFFPAADTIAFTEGGVESMRIDASGNLGLGVTPSAWGGSVAVAIELQSYGGALSSNGAGSTSTNLSHGAYFNGTNWIQKATNVTGARYQMTGSSAGSAHAWFVAPNSTAGGTISFTQAMTLSADGNRALGTSTVTNYGAGWTADTINGTSNGAYTVYQKSGTSQGQLGVEGTEFRMQAIGASTVATFYTNAAERMRLNASGYLGIATASPQGLLQAGVTGNSIILDNTLSDTSPPTSGNDIYIFRGQNDGSMNFSARPGGGGAYRFWSGSTQRMIMDSSGNLLVGKTSTALAGQGHIIQPNGESYATITTGLNSLHVYSAAASAYRFYVSAAGTVFATSTTISAISDQRLKENIQDLDAGLDKIMALRPRKFDWKKGKGKDIKGDRGFIAQEFEGVFPDLIDEWKDPAPEGEEPYKSVRQDLIPVLVKAIQELKAEFDAYKASHP